MCRYGQFDNLMVLMFFLDMGARGGKQTTTISRLSHILLNFSSEPPQNLRNIIFLYVQPLQIIIIIKGQLIIQ